jgi:chromosome segregation ATPase
MSSSSLRYTRDAVSRIETENAFLVKINEKLRRQKTELRKELVDQTEENSDLRGLVADYQDVVSDQDFQLREMAAREKELDFHYQLCKEELRINQDALSGFGGSSGPWSDVVKAKDARIERLMERLRAALGRKNASPGSPGF